MFIVSQKYILCVRCINWCIMEPMTVDGLKRKMSHLIQYRASYIINTNVKTMLWLLTSLPCHNQIQNLCHHYLMVGLQLP